ncbi:MAG: Gldg family protein [Rhodospirillaceae bacterium]|nr:Gldg family protein [Rhodospirillaceae bacterium]
MSKLNAKTAAAAGLVLAVILFVAVNMVSGAWLNTARLDLTAGKAYSTSDQIKPVFEHIAEPIIVRVYFSSSIAEASPRHAVFYQRVRDLLQQYAKLANGKLKVEYYNPLPFSDVEDRAVGFGLQGVPLGAGGEVGYFGLAATNSTDDQQVIPFFNLDREQFLEYDLTKLIYSLSQPNQPKVGLISTLPVMGMPGGGNPFAGGGQGTPPWAIMSQLKDFFDITQIEIDAKEIPKGINLLMLVQPSNLSNETTYAIDQFVMNGGKVLAFVDPNAEAGGMMGPQGPPDFTGISKLMKAWGVQLVPNKVLGDLDAAMRVNMGQGPRPVVADYVAWMQLRAGNLDHSDAITGDLRQINLGTPGALEKVQGATTTVTPLISTGPKSMRIDQDKVMGMPDVVSLFRDFKPEGHPEVIALRITGPAKSAFDAPPAGKDGAKGGAFIKDSKQPLQVVVVADTDILTDRFWTEGQNFFGQQVVTPTADNGNFVANALENLTGSPALSSLRGRGTQSRPFLLVDEIRRDAEQQYRQKEQALTSRLDELQKKVDAMQGQKDANGALVLSDADKATIENYRSDLLATRRELRDVQGALRRNIDTLETVVKFINIGAVPVLFGLILIIAAAVRSRRRKAAAAAETAAQA